MEIEVFADLQQTGECILTSQDFCLESTRPDFYFPDHRTVVYLDGEQVHRKRRDKDMQMRDKLRKRYRLHVLEFPYKRFSNKAKQQIVQEILQALK